MTTREPVPVGPGEIAAMVGLSRQRVDQLSRQVGFPAPWAELLTGRVWRDTDIEAWAKARKAASGRPKIVRSPGVVSITHEGPAS